MLRCEILQQVLKIRTWIPKLHVGSPWRGGGFLSQETPASLPYPQALASVEGYLFNTDF